MKFLYLPSVLALADYIVIELVQECCGGEFGAGKLCQWAKIHAENCESSMNNRDKDEEPNAEVII
jgi:hypothetical protein